MLFALAGSGTVPGVVLLILWGLAYGGVSVSMQTWMLKAAPGAAEAASALLVMAFNLSIALGALAGGLATDATGPASVLWIAGSLALLTTLTIIATHGSKR